MRNNVIRLLYHVRRAKRAEFFIRRGIYFVLVHVSHLVGSTACGSTGNGLRDAETVLIFYPTYERCVFRMVFLLFVFPILVYLASERLPPSAKRTLIKDSVLSLWKNIARKPCKKRSVKCACAYIIEWQSAILYSVL